METENLESLFLLLLGMPLCPGKYLAQVENTWSWDRAMLTADGWEVHERQMPSWGGNEVQSISVETFVILDIPRNIWWQTNAGFLAVNGIEFQCIWPHKWNSMFSNRKTQQFQHFLNLYCYMISMKLPIGFKIRQVDSNIPMGERKIKNKHDSKGETSEEEMLLEIFNHNMKLE